MITFRQFCLTGDDKQSLAPILRAAAVPLLDQNTCKSSEVNGGRNQQILDSMLCAGKLIIYLLFDCYAVNLTDFFFILSFKIFRFFAGWNRSVILCYNVIELATLTLFKFCYR